ncbi:hypothetical protein BDW02DRAFT_304047 [Decorospora gaudefroyi]|uniref:Uncharacterized protein n=1 Tax=Decorospora gaudefroyi TaxID=184978 RepID=A0A6A5KRT0_9PLEO|nr:hypothetical protein BDW02DRAFT_304047 [Decorospora gaudefroyi]
MEDWKDVRRSCCLHLFGRGQASSQERVRICDLAMRQRMRRRVWAMLQCVLLCELYPVPAATLRFQLSVHQSRDEQTPPTKQALCVPTPYRYGSLLNTKEPHHNHLHHNPS